VGDIYIGLMSGTSADSIDCAALNLKDEKINVIGCNNYEIPSTLRSGILEASQANSPDKTQIEILDMNMANVLVASVKNLVHELDINLNEIRAIGSHGQTIKHNPNGDNPFSLQIGNPQKISNDLGITTIGNFRTDDIEAKGQGAPLTPIFHEKVFGSDGQSKIIINIGGIVNISALGLQKTIGFDTGPGNCLMDIWSRRNNIGNYDDEGKWAASGTINHPLLKEMMDDDYFSRNYPKSTGPDYFGENWIDQQINKIPENIAPEDTQATLIQVTALSIARAIEKLDFTDKNIYLCGGGSHNKFLIQEIEKIVNGSVYTSEKLGIDPDYLEAICFGWFAKQRIKDVKFDLSQITGSIKEVYVGRKYEPTK